MAVSADGQAWTLLNCAPDILEQIRHTPALQPRKGLRHSPITTVVLTNGDIDHIGGLLSLREKQPLTIYATQPVLNQLAENPVFGVLDRTVVTFQAVQPKVAFSPQPGLDMQLFAVPGKVPLYREGPGTPMISRDGNTSGLHVDAAGKRLSYVPGCAAIDHDVLHELERSEVLLFDGTLFTDDEMITAGLGEKTGLRMGHVSVSGPNGAITGLKALPATRRVFIHINNSNPMLVEGSVEALHAAAHGWDIGYDGMEIRL